MELQIVRKIDNNHTLCGGQAPRIQERERKEEEKEEEEEQLIEY